MRCPGPLPLFPNSFGARISIGIGLAAVGISACLGTAVGVAAGYFGGWADEIFMRITDMFLAFPEMVAAIALAGIMGPGDLNLVFAISSVSWTNMPGWPGELP